MESVSKFNGLNGANVTRKAIRKIIVIAENEEQQEVVKRLEAILADNPKDKRFNIIVNSPATEAIPPSVIACFQEDDINEDAGLGKVSQQAIYDMVTEMILNTIQKVGHLPWQKEWEGSGGDAAKNYVSGKPYTGINFLLNFEVKYDVSENPYLVPIKFEQPYYLTFKQIENAGAVLKKGSKARNVFYYAPIFIYRNGELEIKTNDREKFRNFIKDNGISVDDVKVHSSKVPVIRYYNVYRADDCEGLKFPDTKPRPDITPIAAAQAIIDNYPDPPQYTYGGDDAAYFPQLDLINMPVIEDFSSQAFYYSTFFHEIVHSTGHSKRLDRGNDTRRRDGSKEDKKAYAFEELVAELGAVYLSSEAGTLFVTKENSAKYLSHWNSQLIKILKEDNRFFFRAAAAAQKAVNHVLDLNSQDVPAYILKSSEASAQPRKKQRVAVKPATTEKNNETPQQLKLELLNGAKKKAPLRKPSRKISESRSNETGLQGANGELPKSIPVELPVNEPEHNVKSNARPGSLAERRAQRQNEVIEYYTIENPEIAQFLGEIEIKKKESVVITLAGEQGSMKTRMGFQLMEAFGQNYKVGHASIEEHPDSSLYFAKVDEYLSEKSQQNISAPDIDSLEDLHQLILANDVVFIDSFAKMKEIDKTFEVDKDLRKKYDGKLFIVIFQQTSDGSMRGGTKSQYDADIVLLTAKFPDYKENYSYPNKNRYNSLPVDHLKFNIFSGKMIRPQAAAQEVADPAPAIPSGTLKFDIV